LCSRQRTDTLIALFCSTPLVCAVVTLQIRKCAPILRCVAVGGHAFVPCLEEGFEAGQTLGDQRPVYDHLGKDAGLDDVFDGVVVSRRTQSNEVYGDDGDESAIDCQMVTDSLHVVDIHKAGSEDDQELDAPMEPGVEAPNQGECERPQKHFNEKTNRFYDDPSQVLKTFSMLAHSLTRGSVLLEPRQFPTAQTGSRAKQWKSMNQWSRLHSGRQGRSKQLCASCFEPSCAGTMLSSIWTSPC
jgi:hypothetical protein